MTDQSIEDAKAFEESVNSFSRGQKLDITKHHDSNFGTYLFDATECAYLAFREARSQQRSDDESISQSEPVAWMAVDGDDPLEPISDALKKARPKGYTRWDIPLYAAPQQAILAETELASIVFTAMDENGLVDPDWVGAESVSENIAKRILHYSMLSASPTAPIESDK
jgi:hypothetical protein